MRVSFSTGDKVLGAVCDVRERNITVTVVGEQMEETEGR